MFNETERELSSVIAKADLLSRQLQDFENAHCEPSISEECQRLRSELIVSGIVSQMNLVIIVVTNY